MNSFTIDEVPIPVALDASDAAGFIDSVEVRNAVEAAAYGTAELGYSAAELLPGWFDAHEPKRLFVARVDGRVVARAVIETLADETEVAWLAVEVLPHFRGRGIGTALADRLELLGRADSRTRFIGYAVSPDAPGDRLPSPTGFGSIPRQNPEVRFLLRRGYTLEQVERGSRLALPVEQAELELELGLTAKISGPAYSLHSWVDRTPSRWRIDMAALYTRMSIEEPSAGLQEPVDVWTVDRLMDAEEREAANPRTYLVAAVEHLPSGHLIAYTALSVPAERGRPAHQGDTLVLPEHRGHRLGMLLKLANVVNLQRERPGHPAITTFNAEENRHMLSINEAIGFVPIGYEGAWKKSGRQIA